MADDKSSPVKYIFYVIHFEACPLCGFSDGPLKDSHIIPKFISEWIKSTGMTGRLRDFDIPNRPVQDGFKIKGFCAKCEEELNKNETYFAPYFFGHIDSNCGLENYDCRLRKFAVGLAVRGLIYHKYRAPERFARLKEWQKKEIEEAIKTWSNFLVNDLDDQIYHHFISLTHYTENPFGGVPTKYNLHLMRGVSISILNAKDDLAIMTVIPGFIFVSNIQPREIERVFEGEIKEGGNIQSRFGQQDVSEIIGRKIVEMISLNPNMSEVQARRVEELMMKFLDTHDPDTLELNHGVRALTLDFE